MMDTFADNTAAFASHIKSTMGVHHLQTYLEKLKKWLKGKHIKANHVKLIVITFIICRQICPSVTLNYVKQKMLSISENISTENSKSTKRKELELKL